VSKEQFAAVVLGLITYRIPLFLRQLLNPLIFYRSGDSSTNATFLPGSAGIALKIMQNAKKKKNHIRRPFQYWSFNQYCLSRALKGQGNHPWWND
jgi:hypothetical protein